MTKNQSPLQTQEAAALLKDTARLKALLTSPETRKLMGLLSSQGGDLKQAAQQAKSGDVSALTAMLQKVMNTSEGAELAEKLNKRV